MEKTNANFDFYRILICHRPMYLELYGLVKKKYHEKCKQDTSSMPKAI